MKFLITSFVIFFSSLLSFAQNNPQIRICHDLGANFTVANIPGDQIGLCQAGSSSIGAIDLIHFYWEQKTPDSIQNYISGNTVCPNQETISLPIFEGSIQSFCIFQDGSVMDSFSFQLGRWDSANQSLNQLLGL